MRLFALSLLALVFVTGCSGSSSGSQKPGQPKGPGAAGWAKAENGESPTVSNGVIEYPRHAGEDYEGWEIVNESADQVWLNYSRFAVGEKQYRGQPTNICMLRNGTQKMFGVGEAIDRLSAAMWNVMGEPQTSQVTMSCPTYEIFMMMHPEVKSIQDIFNTIQ